MSSARTAENQSAPKATRREWVGLAVISLPCLLYSMDLTVLNLAVPRISVELRPTSSQLLWIVDIYGFFLAGLLVTMGTLGDRIGRRRLLLIGAAAFGTASVLAALSSSAPMLIAARALLGAAGATLAPSTLSLICHMFVHSNQRALAIGVWTMCHSVGGAIGPLIGGLLLQNFGWGSVFLIGVPVMVLLLVLGPVLLPEFKNSTNARMDLISASQSLAAVLLVIYGLKHVAAYGWKWSALTSLGAGAAFGIAFVRRQLRLENPLIDLHLLCASAFSTALFAFSLGCFVAVGISLFTAQYLQLVLGLSPLQAGLWMLPATLGYVIGSILTPAIVRRVPPASTMSAGLTVAAVGLAMIAQIGQVTGIQVLVGGLFIFSLGLAPVFIPAIDLMVGAVPPERAGEASAISETGSELGAALGIAILGSIGTAIYRSTIASAIPAGILPETAQTASDTLGGAFSAAQQLPEDLSVPLLNAARAAFVDSMHMVAALSATMVTTMAIVIAVLASKRADQAVRLDETNR